MLSALRKGFNSAVCFFPHFFLFFFPRLGFRRWQRSWAAGTPPPTDSGALLGNLRWREKTGQGKEDGPAVRGLVCLGLGLGVLGGGQP